MRVVFGRFLLGRTDGFDYECIKTQFLFIGFPLIPIASYYVTPSERRSVFLGERDPNTADGGLWTYTRIPDNGKSIGAAYARWWGIMLVLFVTANGGKPPWAGLVTALVWIALFVTSSMTSKREKTARRALLRATGVGAWPEIQYVDTAQRVFDALVQTWRSQHEKQGGQHAWRKVEPADVKTEDLSSYYALCRYARVVEGKKWAEKTEAALKTLATIPVE